MKHTRSTGALFLLALLTFGGGPAPIGASGDLLTRMTALNPHLRSYEATIHVDIALHTFPYISPSLDGTYYHKEPSKDKIAFNTVPAIAAQFNKIYPHVESPSRWKKVFAITNQGDDGTQTTFKLVPRVRGRVDHITVKADDKTATVVQMTWNYNDGGFATMNQTFTQVKGNYVASGQTGHVEVPNYKADVVSSFSNFRLNPSIPDSVFKQD
ncbi:MAG: hypothetical protein NVS9B12_00110 [Vulcanimicrobiaceae bacterium]